MAHSVLSHDPVNVEVYERELATFVFSFKTHPKKAFVKDFGFRILFTLRTLKPDWDMLRAVVNFWDPVHHTFNFAANEMVPTVEEFAAICGMPLMGPISVPTFHGGVTEAWASLLGLSTKDVNKMKHGNAFDITDLPMLFSQHSEDPEVQSLKRNALAICLFSEVLFVSPSGTADVQLAEIIFQAKGQRHGIIPLIVGETLHHSFMGSDFSQQLQLSWGNSRDYWVIVPPYKGSIFLPEVYLNHLFGTVYRGISWTDGLRASLLGSLFESASALRYKEAAADPLNIPEDPLGAPLDEYYKRRRSVMEKHIQTMHF